MKMDLQLFEREWEEAQEEVKALMDLLSPEQRLLYRDRVIDGFIDGSVFVSQVRDGCQCGCAYGTAGILLDWSEVQIRGFANRQRQNIDIKTTLEQIATWIGLGDTPENNPESAWLLAEVEKWIS